jgi:hypothetical protein
VEFTLTIGGNDMLTKPDEMLRWHDVDDVMPDNERMVLVFMPEESEPEQVWMGYYDSDGGWCGLAGMPLSFDVIAWCEMPKGPGKNEDDEE